MEPKTKADYDKMGLALQKLAQEDPSFRVRTDEESNQTIISGMGELHLEIIVDRLKREFSDAELVELAFACSIFNWGNKFNITMRLDTDGNEYPKGMQYKDAGTFWRRDSS